MNWDKVKKVRGIGVRFNELLRDLQAVYPRKTPEDLLELLVCHVDLEDLRACQVEDEAVPAAAPPPKKGADTNAPWGLTKKLTPRRKPGPKEKPKDPPKSEASKASNHKVDKKETPPKTKEEKASPPRKSKDVKVEAVDLENLTDWGFPTPNEAPFEA